MMSADEKGPPAGTGQRKRVCFVVASEITATAFLTDQIRQAALTYDVCVALNTSNTSFLVPFGITAEVVPVPIERKIAPLADICALYVLQRLFRTRRIDLVHSVTPKAGLLAMMAGVLARVPRRLHIFTGQVWVTRTGPMRWLLRNMDTLLAMLATHVLVDSPSQRDFLIAEHVMPEMKATVLAHGSVSGVDPKRFRPDATTRASTRREIGIDDDAILFLYLGRLNRDKGVVDLGAAFAEICGQRSNLWLALIGPDEEGLLPQLKTMCRNCGDHVRAIGYTAEPERFLTAADIFCLPSYREGFGTTVIEAAACGVPAIASRIYGITDAVLDGTTGILHDAGDRTGLASAMMRLATDSQLRQKLGKAARVRVLANFAMPTLTSALLGFYAKILK